MNHEHTNAAECSECSERQGNFPDITNPEEIQKKLQEATELLSDAGFSFFIAVSAPIKVEGQIKPLSVSSMSSRPTQSGCLLSAVWAGLGQYVLSEYDGPVTDDTLDALFDLGASEANAVMSMTIRRSRAAAAQEAQMQRMAGVAGPEMDA